jgi:hypothetical protein
VAEVCKVCGLEPDPENPTMHTQCIETYRSSMCGSDLQSGVTLATADLLFDAPPLPRAPSDSSPAWPEDDRVRLLPEPDILLKVPIA